MCMASKQSVANKSTETVFIVSRDCHKSVFDGLSLSKSDAILLPIDVDPIFQVSCGVDDALTTIQLALQRYPGSAIAGLILTRPTYQGLIMPADRLRAICELCHSQGIPVIIDEAHGSHLTLLESEDKADCRIAGALHCGADMVVQSAHKTLNSLTQTAMLHLSHGNFLSFSIIIIIIVVIIVENSLYY